ncbi:hypothetical protein [Pseudidiomarina insulisalsae]|uniref:Uncharacterized protein n=1 Tax=Pseudidiomarina insulisalsae TaxID=575789 RepID=A0A432YDD1_9GAMM|nr:hypothetical protein [Pseudidiomarina insulisalsae]RUO59005.1 hypothetical protein CWI71_09295 [Pseudidiomarina insulisalsae]
MIRLLTTKLAAIVLFFAGFALVSVPSALLLYLAAWILSFIWSIDFSDWLTHVVIIALAVVWTIYAMNTDQADKILSKIITGKH